jgi:hypothetical protein
MRIQDAEKLINSTYDSWLRLEQVRRMPGGLELCFSLHNGRRGKKIDGWKVNCRGVHEAKITSWDGGGIALYPSNHPAARQYFDRQAELRWSRTCDENKILAALCRAHVEAVDDWIPFDSYLQINSPYRETTSTPYLASGSGRKFVCRGPYFLLRSYAKALESVGEPTQMTLRKNQGIKNIRPEVLHFGNSNVVADSFTAQRLAAVE